MATKASLIRIYEELASHDLGTFISGIVDASGSYGRITGVVDEDQTLDRAFRRLSRAQGAPSNMLLLWLMQRREALRIGDSVLIGVADDLVDFFVRRNLTGYPQTYALPRLFMEVITDLAASSGSDTRGVVLARLRAASVSDEAFRERLTGPIYDENSDVARFILTTLAEDSMTKESKQDLWRREKGHFVWTIEHVLPQGANLPPAWKEMLGGAETATQVQDEHVHRLGNLTITGYNSNLGNKSFQEKKHRKDAAGRSIGYANGLSLNHDLLSTDNWGSKQIEARTKKLADQVLTQPSSTIPDLAILIADPE